MKFMLAVNEGLDPLAARIVAYLNSVQTRLVAVRKVQSATGGIAPKADVVTVRAG